jgi:tRNA pseudouridine13 synthase
LPEPLFGSLRTQTLPVPGWDSRIEDPRIAGITARVLESESIELGDLKVRQLSGLFVNGIDRPALLLPQDFRLGSIEEDELNRGRKKMTLEFFLPRGGYATLIVKRLQAAGSTGDGSARLPPVGPGDDTPDRGGVEE